MASSSTSKTMSSGVNTGATNEDPLGIDKLSVDYDYLLYKINDYVTSIQMETIAICKRHNELITDGIVEGVIEKNIQGFDEILKKCQELENHFDMMDQIAQISESFKFRLKHIIHDYKCLKG